MSIQRSWLTSCLMISIGNRGARSGGPMGWSVPGWITGGKGPGRSAWMLYQRLGRSFSSSRNLVCATEASFNPGPRAAAGGASRAPGRGGEGRLREYVRVRAAPRLVGEEPVGDPVIRELPQPLRVAAVDREPGPEAGERAFPFSLELRHQRVGRSAQRRERNREPE